MLQQLKFNYANVIAVCVVSHFVLIYSFWRVFFSSYAVVCSCGVHAC